jgi:catechol 2,3-dioxygenase-like lactoylglutathione lyase family enzyme
MEQRLSVITLGVRDVARARRFYEEGLGWRLGGGEDDVAFYQAGSLVFALFDWARLAEDAGLSDEGSGFRGVTLAHNTRTQGEVDSLLARAEAAGARITIAARKTFWGGYAGSFADPDGHLWEIAWNPFWEITAAGATRLPPIV